MSVEQDVFQRQHPDFRALVKYGFKHQKDGYHFKKEFFDHQFEADITVNSKGAVNGQVLDTATDKEYLPLRAAHLGPFASEVHAKYLDLLNDIAKQCFVTEPFVSDQANRITSKIKEQYGDDPEFVFVRYPHTALFREPEFKKWYAVIADEKRQRLIKNDPHAGGETVSAMNFRVSRDQRQKLLKQPGVYPAYGTIKKNWLTVLLDDTQDDQTILAWLSHSHQLLTNPKSWIIPANPKYYDIMHAFDQTDVIEWKQSANIRIGDTVFMYVTSPVKAVVYQCRVLANNIPYNYHDHSLTVNRVMKIRLIKRFDPQQFTFDYLKQHGVKAIRGPRHLPGPLLKQLLNTPIK